MAKFLGTTGLQRLVQWIKSYAKITVKNNVSTITIGDNSITPLTEHQDISGKVDKTTTVNGHALSGNVTVTASDIGVAAGAEVNQNAFSNVKVGTTTVAADSKTDTVEFAVGTGANGGLTIEGDATNGKVTIKGKSEAAANGGTDLSMVTTDEKYTWNNKQDALTFDTTPTEDSTNPVTSGGIYEYGNDLLTSANGYAHHLYDEVIDVDLYAKADKVSNATANNLAALDANGNLIDSGVSATSAGTDTKNTTGSTADAAKLFIVGAKEQSANPVTYSQANAYVTAGKVYSNAKEVVNLSDTQALTNKTYNGYTLAAACAKAVDTSIASGSTSTNVPTSQAVANAIAAAQVGAAAFQGTAPTTFAPTNYKKGYYWVVATAGTYAGETCEPGDMIFCVSDYSSSYKDSDFSVVQNNVIEMTTADVDAAIAAADE